jgi:hypothetical protein
MISEANSRESERASTPAYRFSFAGKVNTSEEKVKDQGLTIDMLTNIQKT